MPDLFVRFSTYGLVFIASHNRSLTFELTRNPNLIIDARFMFLSLVQSQPNPTQPRAMGRHNTGKGALRLVDSELATLRGCGETSAWIPRLPRLFHYFASLMPFVCRLSCPPCFVPSLYLTVALCVLPNQDPSPLLVFFSFPPYLSLPENLPSSGGPYKFPTQIPRVIIFSNGGRRG